MDHVVKCTLTGFVLLLSAPDLVMGQDALGTGRGLGSGHALDANAERGSGGINSAGPSVVGRLGSASPRSFGRAFDLTTDAAFRQHNIQNVGGRLLTDSLYNNPWYWQNAGSLYTEMLTGGSGSASVMAATQQGYYNPFFYDQWETSKGRMQLGAGQQLVGLPSPLDAQSQRVAAGAAGNLLQVPTRNSTFLQDDRLGSMIRSGRDHWRRSAVSNVAGYGMNSDQSGMRYTLSYMRGVGRIAGQHAPQDIGLDDWDTSRLSADMVSARPIELPGQPWSTRFKRLAMDIGRMEPNRINGSLPGLLQPVLQSVADRYSTIRPGSGSAQEAMDALDRDYTRIRGAVLRGGNETLDELLAYLDEETAAAADTLEVEGGNDGGDATSATGIEPVPQDAISATEFGLILQHGQRLDSLSTGDNSRFDDLVTAAEMALRDGEYLRADRRFSRALRFIPGHPLATAGLVNAQVGAGLYLSASLTLKSLLGFQPEMIDVQFDAALLPQHREFDRAISILTDRLQQDEDLDRYGLILAWIGHQLQRDLLVEFGLDAMRRSGRDQNFTSLLEQVWASDAIPEEEPAGRVPLTPISDEPLSETP